MHRTTILDVNGIATDSHEFCRRYVEPDTQFLVMPRVVLLQVAGQEVEALIEHWTWAGITARTIAFQAANITGQDENSLKQVALKYFSAREGPRPTDFDSPESQQAVTVSVSHGAGQSFVLVTLTRWADLRDA